MQYTRAEALLKDLFNDILYIVVSYTVSVQDIKNRKSFILTIRSTGAPVYTKKKKNKYPGLYFPVFRANTSHGG